jgi:hypothetical protein
MYDRTAMMMLDRMTADREETGPPPYMIDYGGG